MSHATVLRVLRFSIPCAFLLVATESTLDATSAGLVVIAPTISVPYSDLEQSGHFEVHISSDLNPQPQVSDFSLTLALPQQSSVSLTSTDRPVLHPYIFGESQTPATAIPSTFMVQATDFVLSNTVLPLADGAGLLKINYTIAAKARGAFPITIEIDPKSSLPTTFSDLLGNPLGFTIQNGSISVVPEPSSIVLGLPTCLTMLLFKRSNGSFSLRPSIRRLIAFHE